MNREERRTHSHTKEDVVGLEKDIRKVVDQLLKEDVNVVAISGIGGLGKTTLARKVFKHEDIKGHFNESCVWVYISKEFESRNIFQEILFGLEKDENTRNKIKELPFEGLLTKIHELLRKQKCLIVLDDIWTVKAWESLKPAFESIRGSSSKIFLTTRTQSLLQNIDSSGYLHLLQPLTFEDSWKLLQHKAFPGHQSITDEFDRMKKLGEEMLKHCGGLPIAIIAVGGILSTKKTLSDWEDVGKNISSYLMSGLEQEGTNSGVLGILELSYNELPFYLKPCFLYLGNFPEDYQISTQRLYHLWEAEGLLGIEGESKRKGGTSYDIGERYLNELVQRSMVQVGKCWTSGRVKTCQVHDVMRDMCLRKCEEVSFLSHIECTKSGMVSVSPPFSVEIKKSRRCSLHGEGFFLKEFQFGEKAIGLRSLLVFTRRCTPAEKIWTSVPLLRVLDLQGVSAYRCLNGLKHLIHLRYLSVKKSYLDELPSCLFELQYLETLDLRCNGIMLRNKFFKMKRLRHLYLPRYIEVKGGKKLRFPTGGQMETIKNFDLERCETKELMQMTNMRVFSVKKGYIFDKAEELKLVLEAPLMKKGGQLINSFGIGIHEDVIIEDPVILSSAARHSDSFKELSISGGLYGANDGKNGNGIIFPNSLVFLELNVCEAIGEGDFLLGLEKLPSLQVLNLKFSVIGGNRVSFSAGSFPNLREFRIYCPNKSFEWEVGETAAPNLQLLELNKCQNLNKLKNIPNSLTRVVLLDCGITEGDVLALEKLPHLKYLELEGYVGYKLSFSTDSFPQLTQLSLRCQTELEEWEVGEGALPNLQRLYLQSLKKVNKLPHSLTEVKLEDCEIGQGDDSLCGCLEKLPRLQLLCLCDQFVGGGGSVMRFSPGSFPQLTQLILSESNQCNEWEWEVGEGALSSLQHLKLDNCYMLKKLPQGLPTTVYIECIPCVKGIENYNTCPRFIE